MAKVMNDAFGIGIAVILFIVVFLGIQVFYPEPTHESFNCPPYYGDSQRNIYSCNASITVAECRDWIDEPGYNSEREKYATECYSRLSDAREIHGRNIFIITSLIGIALVITSLFLLSLVHIAAGFAFSGIVLIIYGFMRGWQETGDVLKFVVALFVMVLFIVLAVMANKLKSRNSE